MANVLDHDPLILDTADASAVVVQGQRFVYGIKWVAPGGTGSDVAELRVKATSAIFWRQVAGALIPQAMDVLRMMTPGDLILPTLDSGSLRIYLGPVR